MHRNQPRPEGRGFRPGETMTSDELQRLRLLSSAATPGPWEAGHVPLSRSLVIHGCISAPSGEWNHAGNAAFIAAAREALPALLDEVEHLRTVAHVAAAAAEVHGYARAVADVVAWLRVRSWVGDDARWAVRQVTVAIEQGAHVGAAGER